MKTSNNTILITGGGSGIGLEMTKQFSFNNKVIITGRNVETLKNAASDLPNVSFLAADVTDAESVENLVQTLYKDFPELNLVINNAGLVHYYKLTDENANAFEKAGAEMLTNYLSTVRLTEKLLPLLRKQEEAAFVNVSSITAFSAAIPLPGYGISKSALHAYSQVLRISLEREPEPTVRVFELMPPLVNTPFSKEAGGENGMSPEQVVLDLKDALQNDIYEIHPGDTANFYKLFLSSPRNALESINGSI